MLIDERIEDLSERDAKRLLREATEKLAERMACEACAMKIACGSEPTDDDCMHRVLSMLYVSAGMTMDPSISKPEDEEEQDNEGTILYDPETMQII